MGALLLFASPTGDRTADERGRATTTAAGPPSLAREALAHYAEGEVPAACEKFSRAADSGPSNPAWSESAARCFESWGWQALREKRPDEAMLLFRRGLHDEPGAPGLLRGLAVAAVNAGHPDDALAPLEEVARIEDDAPVRLLLALLYDRRDDAERSRRHLDAVLARDPGNDEAKKMLGRLDRERRAETGFERELTKHFVVRSPRGIAPERRAAIVAALEDASARIRARLGYTPTDRLTVVLYDRDDFKSVTGAHDWAGGAFDGKIRLPLGRPDASGKEFERVFLHEYAHAAIHELSRGRAPRWLHEGLAQVLDGAVVDPMLRVPGAPTLAGVEALIGDADPPRARTGYDLALWIVSDLLDRGGMPAMRGFLRRLGAGEPLPQALGREYGLSLAELETHWRRILGG